MNHNASVHAPEVQACGRIIGGEQYWDINGETVSEADLRKWICQSFPEDSCWHSANTGIVTYHVVAYAHRRRALHEFMKTVQWKTREAKSDDLRVEENDRG